jgi:hypothetical protein
VSRPNDKLFQAPAATKADFRPWLDRFHMADSLARVRDLASSSSVTLVLINNQCALTVSFCLGEASKTAKRFRTGGRCCYTDIGAPILGEGSKLKSA